MLKLFLKSQKWLSKNFDRLLPEKFRQDGQTDYQNNIVPAYLKENLVIYDIGGGKRPYLDPGVKKHYKAAVVGLDISQDELDSAPDGAYDQTICADITGFRGSGNADLIICQSLLEHIQDVKAALAAFQSILKPGGLALVFVPSRNALFARLNMLTPQAIKKKLLYTFFPGSKKKLGFPAFYEKCTPSALKKVACESGFSVVHSCYYYNCVYFRFFFPFHLLWRMWLLLYFSIAREQAAETFTLVLKKNVSIPNVAARSAADQ